MRSFAITRFSMEPVKSDSDAKYHVKRSSPFM